RRPLCVGDTLTRRSTILDITEKEGHKGPLVFVRVLHEYLHAGESDPALVEFHDIVYRGKPLPGEAAPGVKAPIEAPWKKSIVPDDVLLFRYSALTLNSHRIHYDWRYTTEHEGYPGLIVHGPLLATLLLELLREHRPEAELADFEFRALHPLFAPHPFVLCGAPQADGKIVRLRVVDHEGNLGMEATASLR
ncbi:MAG: MaoC family dehydratase N-terminal domain-containing protein, partial [Candidatus Accumulibacter sp.]|nr:MaoC family dehydratase N-terminal domain-containing protein [Accumulibacter sp.]